MNHDTTRTECIPLIDSLIGTTVKAKGRVVGDEAKEVWVIARPEKGSGMTYWLERFRMCKAVLQGRADAVRFFQQ